MIPKMMMVKQKLNDNRIENLDLSVETELDKLQLEKRLPRNATIGITAGSRGIKDIVNVLQLTISYLKKRKYNVKIVIAMGSHGGGTSKGQLEILKSLGITEESMGVEILSGSEVVQIGKTKTGLKAYLNKNVFKTDGVIIINRIKLHTALSEDIQSGLIKKSVVGLGGPDGAKQFHSLKFSKLTSSLKELGEIILNSGYILGGLGIIENSYDDTYKIAGLNQDEFFEKEPTLLKESIKLFPKLPFKKIDVLVIKEMGKNYSGTGIDTNVIERLRVQGTEKNNKNKIERIVVLNLSDESHGNANGIGLADFTTKKLVDKIDFKSTYLNVMTSRFVQRCFIPIICGSEKIAIKQAINSLSNSQKLNYKIVIIPNTLELENILISTNLRKEAIGKDLEIVKEDIKLEFDEEDNLKTKFN